MWEKDTNLTHFKDCTAHSQRLVPRSGKKTELRNKPAGSLLVHPTRPHPPGWYLRSLDTEVTAQRLTSPPPHTHPPPFYPNFSRGANGAESLVLTVAVPGSAAPARASVPRAVPVPGGGQDLGAVGAVKGGRGGSGQQVLTRVRKAQPRSSPPAAGGPSAAPPLPGFPRAVAPRARQPALVVRCSARPPPEAATARGSGAPPGAAGAAVAAEGGGGYRRARPFAGCDRGCATCGAGRTWRAPGTGDGWEEPRTRGILSLPAAPGGLGGRSDQQRSSRSP